MEEPQKKKRIGIFAGLCIVGLALICDGVQFLLTFIPLLGWVLSMVIGFIAAMVFAVWFAILGVDYFAGKRAGIKLVTALSSVITELIPILGAIPATTLGVLVIIVITRTEDDEQFALLLKKHQEKMEQAAAARKAIPTNARRAA